MPAGLRQAPPKPTARTRTTTIHSIDVTNEPAVAITTELVKALSKASDPADVLRTYSEGMAQLRASMAYLSMSCRELPPGDYKITRKLLDGDMTAIANANPWRDWDQLPTHRGGLLGDIIGGGKPVLMTDVHVTNDPVLGDEIADYRSLLAFPIYDNGEPINWAVQLRHEPDAYTMEEFQEVLLTGNLVGNTVRHVRTAKLLREANEQIYAANKRIRDEVERIAALQRALLPRPIPDIPGLRIAASYETFDQAGGDLYDVVRVPDVPDRELWAVLIGDVSGHGPAAAVIMAMLNSILAAYSGPEDPGEVLAHANRHLIAKQIDQSFVTAFLAGYEADTRAFHYARAGHNPPLLLTPGSGQTVRRVDALDQVGSLPLGIVDNVRYDVSTVQLEPGQTILLYTDGITEARAPSGELFGEERLEKTLTDCGCAPEQLVSSIRAAVDDFQGPERAGDDRTLLVLQVE